MQGSKRATIRDVARAAGVSATTVSHALNGKGTVNRETVERIERAAAEIGYRPSTFARGLQSRRFGLLALVIRPLGSLDTFLPEGVDYFLRMAGAASLTAMEHGYSMMLIDDPTRPTAPASALAADAYIVSTPFANDPVLTMLAEQRIPFVSVGVDPARPGEFVEIDEDERADAKLVFDHLDESGARRIALVTGTDENAWNELVREAFIERYPSSAKTPLVLAVPETSGVHVGDEVLDHFGIGKSQNAPDAVFCLTGRHAAGVTEAAIRRGVKIPQDLMVVAGSEAAQNRTSSPSVTSLNLRPEANAKLAVEVAVQLVEGVRPEAPLMGHRSILNIRESTKRATLKS